ASRRQVSVDYLQLIGIAEAPDLNNPVARLPHGADSRPSSTMRIFSSAERCRRVALRISRTVFSALSGTRLLACLIIAPQRGYDEPGILSYAISSFCPTSADGLQRPQDENALLFPRRPRVSKAASRRLGQSPFSPD